MDDMTDAKLIPYNDQFLTLSHYKEPLRKVEKGYGYYGALLSTQNGDYIQCHECGELYEQLPYHVKIKHKLTSREYKEKYRLNISTALVCEKERLRRKHAYMKQMALLSPEEKMARLKKAGKVIKEARKRRGNKQPKERLESKNIKGTCPDQLLAKIKEVADKLGKTPTKSEFILECGTQRYVHLIYKTFGSWTKALSKVDMKPPSNLESWGGYRKYSDDELLEYLSDYAREFGVVPTQTEFRRGYLPSYSVYIRRFGSIQTARELAGIDRILESIDTFA